eukprot:TRINITY_DN2904_c0_g1_i1.p1 TRINITY_DN2904_c0_g1~~TRINITY_DN2904_c0_g1_i1.p1  ORF type:complete len:406 (-),score=116.87 TRINITY_DN2904_c0_g1_i1:52-1269(-)
MCIRDRSTQSTGIYAPKMLPAVPKSFLSTFGRGLQDAIAAEMDSLQEEIAQADERRDTVFKATRSINRSAARVLFEISIGDFAEVDGTIAKSAEAVSGIVQLLGGSTKREGNLSQTIQSLAEACLLQQFFLSGKLVNKAALAVPCSDDEYLCAALGVAQHLARYCVGRAVEADVASIALCRTLVSQLMEQMLQFDLRNGPLRRKYDGLKYALKKLETITYELSLLEPNQEPDSKKRKVGEQADEPDLVDIACFGEIKTRLEAYDQLREQVIKGSRDVQKLAKQSIFSVHRGKLQDAQNQMKKAQQLAVPLLEIIKEHPTLRHGAFGNSLEEWAEAALSYEWRVSKRVMPKAEMAEMTVETGEYVGALSDFTGEVCRMAVAAASQREIETVRELSLIHISEPTRPY